MKRIVSLSFMISLFGDSVNTASRMESNSKENRILCSFDSVTLLRDQGCRFKIKKRGKIRPKGLREMLVYWIEDSDSLPTSMEVVEDVDEENKVVPPPESAITLAA